MCGQIHVYYKQNLNKNNQPFINRFPRKRTLFPAAIKLYADSHLWGRYRMRLFVILNNGTRILSELQTVSRITWMKRHCQNIPPIRKYSSQWEQNQLRTKCKRGDLLLKPGEDDDFPWRNRQHKMRRTGKKQWTRGECAYNLNATWNH